MMEYRGMAGENVTWSWDKDTRELRFDGTGAMYDYTSNDGDELIPWLWYIYDSAKKITFGEGITHIGNYSCHCFLNKGCIVKIADSVTSIGNYAFVTSSDSYPLFDIGKGISELGTNCIDPNGTVLLLFRGETAPTTVGLKNTSYFKVITNGWKFESLTAINYPTLDYGNSEDDAITWDIDYDKNAVVIKGTGTTRVNTSSTAGSSIIQYLQNIFEGLIIEDTVSAIGNYSFYNLTQFKYLTIGSGVSSIGEYAFAQWYNIRMLEFKGEKPTFGTLAFNQIASLSQSKYSERSAPMCVTPGWGNAEVFQNQTSTTKIKNSSESQYKVYCSTLWGYVGTNIVEEGIHWEFNKITKTFRLWKPADEEGNGKISDGNYPFGSLDIEHLIVDEGVVYIGYGTFTQRRGYNASSSNSVYDSDYTFRPFGPLKSIEINSSVLTVLSNAFSEGGNYNENANKTVLDSLKYVKLNEGLEEIHSYVFNYHSLPSITIPSTVKKINDKAFHSETMKSFVLSLKRIAHFSGNYPPATLTNGIVYIFCDDLPENSAIGSIKVNTANPIMIKDRNGWRVIDNSDYYDKDTVSS